MPVDPGPPRRPTAKLPPHEIPQFREIPTSADAPLIPPTAATPSPDPIIKEMFASESALGSEPGLSPSSQELLERERQTVDVRYPTPAERQTLEVPSPILAKRPAPPSIPVRETADPGLEEIIAEPSVITKIARYEIKKTLGEGGMGAVYLAFDSVLKRKVAIKVIHAKKRDAKRQERFLREACAMAILNHPACVQVHDYGVEKGGEPYLVMELVEGDPLIKLIEKGLTPKRAAPIIQAIAGALEVVHGAGLIHRDVKPHNILVGKNGIKLADFGIVKDETGNFSVPLTAPGTLLGTLCYMAPEQAGETTVDARADVYALGATLYHCLTGRPPFFRRSDTDATQNERAKAVAELVKAIREAAPTPPREIDPNVPLDLEAICLKCLEKDRELRYQTAQELHDDLARYLADEPVLARKQSFFERVKMTLRRWTRRRVAS